MANNWGGPWTEIKVDVVAKYLRFYTLALKNQDWCDRIYIDAFAGSGHCDIRYGKGAKTIEGSAKRALENDPPFQKLVFIETDKNSNNELSKLCKNYPKKDINIYDSDANKTIQEICRITNWKKNRAVLFLDPFGQEVNWDTIISIAKTEAIDVWYWFPLSGFYRNLPNNKAALDESKRKALIKLLGTAEWEDFYKEEQSMNLELFEPESEPEPVYYRDANWRDLKDFVKYRLETIFASVAEPLILPEKGSPMFALFFAVSNERAIGPAMRAAKHILEHA